METLNNLRLMKQNWEELGIAKYFSKAHHFSSEKFKTKPSGLQGFFTWCVEREIKEENIQTLNRALKVAEHYRTGRGCPRFCVNG